MNTTERAMIKAEREILRTAKSNFKATGRKAMWHYVISLEKNWNSFNKFQRDHIITSLANMFA